MLSLAAIGCSAASTARPALPPSHASAQTRAALPSPQLLSKVATTGPALDVTQQAEEPATTVAAVSFVADPQDPQPLEPASLAPAATVTAPTTEPVLPESTSPSLQLDDVIESVARAYPEIEIAIGELESAQGKILASWGEFDSLLAAQSISQPLGFYQTYRNGAGVVQPLFQGGEVYGTYRLGDGNFEPWYGERETNEGGELKAGFSVPLRKNRAIDARRANLQTATAQRDQLNSNVDSRLLQFERFATQAYWDWVAAGQAVQVQSALLELAQRRAQQIDARVDSGDLAEISRFDNQRFIAKRTNGLIKARRGLQKAAIKLSIFYRDLQGQPSIPGEDQLPNQLPESSPIDPDMLAADIQTALQRRPELQELVALRQQALVDLQYAQNLTLAKVDLKGFAAQDLGGATSSKGDKTPFELQMGIYAEVPLQRREGLGKLQAAQGKLTQVEGKLQLTGDKIRAEIQDAASALNAAIEQVEQSRRNLRLAQRSLELGRLAFEQGDIDLISLNIYETSVADAQLELIEAQFKSFYYQAQYQTAIMAGSLQERVQR